MTFGEKLKSIRYRLCLSKKHMYRLLKIEKNELEKLEEGASKPSEKVLENIERVFNIKKDDILNNNPIKTLSLTKEFDIKRYKNIFTAYAEILKEYFPEPFEIYILSKFKVKKRLENILNLFFNNDKAFVINEMKTFSPSYLIKKKDINLLVNFENTSFKISELGKLEDEQNFIFENYRYKKANRVEIK